LEDRFLIETWVQIPLFPSQYAKGKLTSLTSNDFLNGSAEEIKNIMTKLLIAIFSVVVVWNAGLADWMVAYATGLAQLGIWVTLSALVPFNAFWVGLKRQSDHSVSETRMHWSLQSRI
jgi:hypothetical protein